MDILMFENTKKEVQEMLTTINRKIVKVHKSKTKIMVNINEQKNITDVEGELSWKSINITTSVNNFNEERS